MDLVTRYRDSADPDGDFDGHTYDWRPVAVPAGDFDHRGVWLSDPAAVVRRMGFAAVTPWHTEDTPAGPAEVADVEQL